MHHRFSIISLAFVYSIHGTRASCVFMARQCTNSGEMSQLALLLRGHRRAGCLLWNFFEPPFSLERNDENFLAEEAVGNLAKPHISSDGKGGKNDIGYRTRLTGTHHFAFVQALLFLKFFPTPDFPFLRHLELDIFVEDAVVSAERQL